MIKTLIQSKWWDSFNHELYQQILEAKLKWEENTLDNSKEYKGEITVVENDSYIQFCL